MYLNSLDQFVKHELRCRHYLRYCDDFVLLADSPTQLGDWRGRIENFLRETLSLDLNPRQRLAPVANGVDFLGYIVRRDYLLVRRRVVGHLRERLCDFESRLVTPVPGGVRYSFDRAVLDELAAVLASYLGHFRIAAAWRLWVGLRRRFAFLAQYFAFDPAELRIVRTYTVPAGFLRAGEQYAWFRRCYPADVLFFQVGRFCEFYAGEDREVASELGLQPMGRNRRGAEFGFPCSRTEELLQHLRDRQQSVLLIGETPVAHARIRGRYPVARYAWSDREYPPSGPRVSGSLHGSFKLQ